MMGVCPPPECGPRCAPSHTSSGTDSSAPRRPIGLGAEVHRGCPGRWSHCPGRWLTYTGWHLMPAAPGGGGGGAGGGTCIGTCVNSVRTHAHPHWCGRQGTDGSFVAGCVSPRGGGGGGTRKADGVCRLVLLGVRPCAPFEEGILHLCRGGLGAHPLGWTWTGVGFHTRPPPPPTEFCLTAQRLLGWGQGGP